MRGELKKSAPKSELVLQGVSSEDFDMFKIALKSFYYPENELLGEKIWENCDGAVYTRSKTQYDCELPYNYDFGRKGIVFAAIKFADQIHLIWSFACTTLNKTTANEIHS